MLGSRDKIIPELTVKELVALPVGAELKLYRADGSLERSFKLNKYMIWVEEI